MGLGDFEALRAGLPAFFTGCLVDFLAISSSRVLESRWGIRAGGASGLSAFRKKLGRGALDDTPGRRGLCLIHRVRPE